MKFADTTLELTILSAATSRYNPSVYTLFTDDFTDKNYRKIYEVMQTLNNSGEQVTLTNVYSVIAKTDEAFARSYIPSLASISTSIFETDNIVSALKDMTKKRKYFELVSKHQGHIAEGENIDEHIAETIKELKDIAINTKTSSYTFGDEGLGVERFKNNVLPTGVSFIDSIIRGFSPGQLIILAARPAFGKSALSLDIAEKMSINGNVAFVNIEMENNEIELRRITRESKITMDTIVSGTLTEIQKKAFDLAEQELLKNKNIKITDSVHNIEGIKNECRKLSLSGKLVLIVIDYLQIIDAKGKGNRAEIVGELTRGCKLLAKELHTPVLLLSQLNRLADGEEPLLAHLRESGSIEQDANIVMFLHQEEIHRGTDQMMFIVAKNRQGQTGKRTIYFKRPILNFHSEHPYEKPSRGLYEN